MAQENNPFKLESTAPMEGFKSLMGSADERIAYMKEETAKKRRMEGYNMMMTGQTDKFMEWAIRYPDDASIIRNAISLKDTEDEKQFKEDSQKIITGIVDPWEPLIRDYNELSMQGKSNSKEAQELKKQIEFARKHPKEFKQQVENMYNLKYPTEYKERSSAIKNIGKNDDPKTLVHWYLRKNPNATEAEALEFVRNSRKDTEIQQLTKAIMTANIAAANARTHESKLRAQNEKEKLEKKKEERYEELRKQEENDKLIRGNIKNTMDVLADAEALVMQSPGTTTGLVGKALGWIPGTSAYNVQKRIDSVKANVGFDKLQAMRDASPTGGALGQVSELELMYLQSTIDMMEPGMGAEAFMEAMQRVRRHYDRFIAALDDRRTAREVTWEELMMKYPDDPKYGKMAGKSPFVVKTKEDFARIKDGQWYIWYDKQGIPHKTQKGSTK